MYGMQECPLGARVSFRGRYDDLECGLEVVAVPGDSGDWVCELEEWAALLPRGAGARVRATFALRVCAWPPVVSAL